MEWWTHLWLNEGFVTWIEYLSVDHTHPEYKIWINFLTRKYSSAMSLDSLANSHPIEVMTAFADKWNLSLSSSSSLVSKLAPLLWNVDNAG